MGNCVRERDLRSDELGGDRLVMDDGREILRGPLVNQPDVMYAISQGVAKSMCRR